MVVICVDALPDAITIRVCTVITSQWLIHCPKPHYACAGGLLD